MSRLLCGAARGCITPPTELLGKLHGLMNREFGGVLDEIYVRVIALKSGEEAQLLISFELDKVPCPADFLRALHQATGVAEEAILLAAVHTHTAPIAGDRRNEGPNNILLKPQEVQEATHAYESFLEEVLVRTAREAMEDLRPARMGVGRGTSYINVDRKQRYVYEEEDGSLHVKYAVGQNPESPISHTLYVMRFEDLGGSPIAYLINYPVHCCVLNGWAAFDGKLGISGDIAGKVSGWNEDRTGAVTLWTSGAAGDINPLVMYQTDYPDPLSGKVSHVSPKGDFYDLLIAISARHYDDIRRVDRQIVCSSSDLPLGSAVEYSSTEGRDCPFEIRLHMMRLGDAWLLGASGELFDCYDRDVRKLIPAENLLVINHDASQLGDGSYIADDLTLCLNRPMLPGMMHTNQKPGQFPASFFTLTRKLYEKLDPGAVERMPEGPGGMPPMGGKR